MEQTPQNNDAESKRRFEKTLHQKVEQLSNYFTQVQVQGVQASDLPELKRLYLEIKHFSLAIHSSAISSLVAELDTLLIPSLKSTETLNDDKLNALNVTLQKLQMLLQLDMANDSTFIDPTAAVSKKLLLIGLKDKSLSDEIIQQLNFFNYHCQTFDSLEEIIEFCKTKMNVRLIILEANYCLDPLCEKKIKALSSQIPLIFVATTENIEMRLLTVQCGGSAYLTTPIEFTTLIEKVDQIVNPGKEKIPYRILIVEDSKTQAAILSKQLKEAGMITEVLTDPLQINHFLTEFQPDLILLDLYMPQCSGTDLTKVIRQQDPFVSIPIVYLSVEDNLEKQSHAISFGGDDFLTKSISPERLISAITTRVQRYRTLHAEMIQDSLTGLLNHTRILEQLDLEIARVKRNKAPLSFVMLDLDDFKMINDYHGHPVGDRVLKSLARILKQRLRKTDSIGRYGGEEFAIILPQTQAVTVYQTLEEIRKGFAKLVHRGNDPNDEFLVTFSAGLAEYSNELNTVDKLVQAADRALYIAKSRGRNQIVLYQV